jgi:ATP-binding cassette subfamily B protein
MMIPKILGIITDGLAKHTKSPVEILHWILIMLGAALAAFGLKFGWRYLLMGNSRTVEIYLRDHLFAHLQKLSVSYYNNRKTGDLIAYAINDIQAIRMMFGPGFLQALDGIIVSVLSLIFMSGTINLPMTLLMFVPIPPSVFLMMRLSRTIRKRYAVVQDSYAAVSDKTQENLSGIRVIKSFAQEAAEIDNFQSVNRDRFVAQMRLTRISALVGPLVQLCFGLGFFFFIVYGSSLVKSGVISLGSYVAFNMYTLIMLGPVSNIARIIEFWQRGSASAKRLNELLSVPEGVSAGGQEVSRTFRGDITIKQLSFAYPGTKKAVLKDISLTIKAGRTLGILGRTGSGKTTLANLILRLFPVEDGRIRIDGTDINEIPAEIVRENIGYVPQDSFLFSTTIKNNIEFFKELYSDSEIEEAARLSQVYDNIISFPNGFETVIGERGVTLSGGQKQRISIARALVKDPSVIILDDSLSAIDSLTEKIILQNIREVLVDRTGIIISHRAASVKNADEIIILGNGSIIERGNHENLLAQRGEYWRLWTSQHDTGHAHENAVVIDNPLSAISLEEQKSGTVAAVRSAS